MAIYWWKAGQLQTWSGNILLSRCRLRWQRIQKISIVLVLWPLCCWQRQPFHTDCLSVLVRRDNYHSCLYLCRIFFMCIFLVVIIIRGEAKGDFWGCTTLFFWQRSFPSILSILQRGLILLMYCKFVDKLNIEGCGTHDYARRRI